MSTAFRRNTSRKAKGLPNLSFVSPLFHNTPLNIHYGQPKTNGMEQPCCVCKDEKAQRDECMLFATSDDAQAECASMVDRYKACMAGFGFKI